jgi:hypothetical protein
MFAVQREEQNLEALSSTTEVYLPFGRLLFGALVDASGRAELYSIIDQLIDPDRLVCTNRISILEASTPNLLIV